MLCVYVLCFEVANVCEWFRLNWMCCVFVLHDNLWLWNTWLYAFMWQHLATVYVDFIFNDDIFAEYRCTFHAHPSANGRTPANYTAIKPCMAFNDCTFQNSWSLDASTWNRRFFWMVIVENWKFGINHEKMITIFNDTVWTDRHVRPNSTVNANFGRWMYQHIANDRSLFGWRAVQFRWIFLPQWIQI